MPSTRLLAAVVLGILVVAALAAPAVAQDDPTYLSLDPEATDVQTGQEYVVTIQVDNVSDLWMASMEIMYDPEKVYIMGTKAGSPVAIGSFLSSDASITVLNRVEDDRLIYMASRLAPAEPVSGSGTVGTFRIYPLAPGTTTLSFYSAKMIATTFTVEGETRVVDEEYEIDFTPAMVELNVTGEQVEPPSEATATPTLTPTISGPPVETRAPEDTPLPNVTMAPQTEAPTPGAAVTEPEEGEDDNALLKIVLIAVVALAVAGVLIALIVLFRSSRR